MGTIAARKAASILEHTKQVLAMELLAACQAIDLRAPAELGAATKPAYLAIRERVPFMAEDRVIAPDMAAVADLINSRKLI